MSIGIWRDLLEIIERNVPRQNLQGLLEELTAWALRSFDEHGREIVIVTERSIDGRQVKRND